VPDLAMIGALVALVALVCSGFSADVRLTQLHGRWVASADTPDGPSLGLGWFPIDALVDALEPFDDLVEELMQTVPEDLRWAEGKIRQDYRAVATADKRGARCPHGHSIPSRAAGGPRCTLGMDCRKTAGRRATTAKLEAATCREGLLRARIDW